MHLFSAGKSGVDMAAIGWFLPVTVVNLTQEGPTPRRYLI